MKGKKGFLTTITQSLVIVPSHGTLFRKHLAKAMTMVVRLFDVGDVSRNGIGDGGAAEADLKFVKNFTRPNFRAKHFTH